MIADIVEGATDKSDSGLRRILAAQAKLRIFVALPVVILETALYLKSPSNVAGRLIFLTACYCLYIVFLHLLVRYRKTLPARQLLVATAVLDPLALSAWLVVTGEYGSLIVGFFLFTILGFGFRTGRPLMHLCQVTGIASFLLVYLSVPYWQNNTTVFLALMLPLIAVPMYAGGLIRTLRESREHAERESLAKSDLLAKVSHELRTPLTGIISATELLAVEADRPAVTRRTDTILNLSNELLNEINDLLDEAKFGARAVQLATEPVDLGKQIQLIDDALDATAQKKGISLRVTLDPLISSHVQTDGHHLGRVLMNLAGNAVKFTDRGHVHVRVELLADSGTEYSLRFSVTDTGIGIPESFHDTMFEPFSQVDQGISRRYGGTGLGLAISRQVVELMGGELRFESTVGKGSRFWFEVKLLRSAPQDLPIAAGSAPESVKVAVKRILVAEDNETNLLLLRELLQIDGHEVTTCASGMAALDLLAENVFDLLLLDYNLGDMDGVRVLQTYHFGRTHPAPALFLTADTTQATAARLGELAGGTGVLYKPITLAKLRKAIHDLFLPNGRSGEVPIAEFAMPAELTARSSRPVLAAVAVSPLDPTIIDELKSVSIRPEFYPTLLSEAGNDIQRSGQQIIEALANGQYASARDAAHALKGVSGNIGALRLYALASKLMSSSREDIDSAHERWADDIGDALRVTLVALRKEVDESRTSPSLSGTSSLHLN